MFITLTLPPTSTDTPAPKRHERKSLICNHPDRVTIAFLIDTLAIRNAPNSFRTNETFISNRHKTGPFYVPYDGAGRQSAQFHSSRLTSHESLITSHYEGILPERIEPLGDRGKGGIGMVNDFAFGGLERLFGGDAGEPAIM
jgi:hypothetical protein